MQLTYAGTYKLGLLMDELLAAYPEWLVGDAPTRHCLLRLEGNELGVRLSVPDDSDAGAIAAVVAAHDPTVLTAGEVLDAESADAKARILGAIDAALTDYAAALERWDVLTAVQQKAVLRRLVETQAQLLRYHRREWL